MDTIWLEITLIAVGIVANGFFAGSEIALVSARISRLAQLREERVAGAAMALHLKESPEAFLATIQVAITTVSTLASAVGGATAVAALTPVFAGAGLGRAAQPAALAVVIVAITYVSLVIGELAPKAIALRDPERMACATAPIVGTVSRVSGWLVTLLTTSTDIVLRLVGLGGGRPAAFVSEDEVRYLVREGAAKGIFEKVEEELVHNVFEFADTTVREIMTPRMTLKGLDIATPPSETLARAAEVARTAFPVWDGSVEQTLGVVSLKDVLRAAARGETLDLRRLARPPLYVPDTARISGLLREFQRSRQELAMVVNEHGSVVGLVTIEDVIEEIVGEIRSEGEAPSSYVSRLPDGSLLIDGMAPVDEVERALGIDLPASRDYATVAGFLLAAFNSVPARGTSVVATGYRWTVVEMDGPRIRRIRAQPVPERV
ncbi:MAG TPA: hemolysin family protein [Terriglobales bacterium]|nr:hemolysin family protein [Terriglobales bacterium]